ncbi:hypothetical protein ACL02T_20660 [Pseudonocardia sp. RS010]|uniref:hypothetical protein n=1 Tax=Pseudonocardia sp. RS010 TaxID=3385979 RepID=UPI0039A2F22C
MSESGRSTTQGSTAPPSGTDEPATRPAERTAYLRVRPGPRPRSTPAADARDTSAAGGGADPAPDPAESAAVEGIEPVSAEAAELDGAEADDAPAVADDGPPDPSTKVLHPVAAGSATIPALPIAPVDPADRPFAHPQRSVPGKRSAPDAPDTLLRRLFRRRRN